MIGLVEGPVSEHREEDVTSASCQRDECLIMSFALRDLSVIVGA